MSDHTKVQTNDVLKDSRTRYFVTIRLLQAYLCNDTNETQYHVWWIQHQYGLTGVQLAVVLDEAREAADGHRQAGMANEIRARIDHQLAEL